jgi:hypothetical protein
MRPLQTHREIADQVRTILGVLGIYLLIFGVTAAIWSVRASIGQVRYEILLLHPREAEQDLSLARRAFRMYPRNYAVCIRAADIAFKAAEKAPDKGTADRLWSEAEYWVGRGMDLNPRLMELHYLRARLLARQSREAAVDAWKVYADWHFWDPRNLDILARFQEEAGQDAAAMQTLNYLKGWPNYDSWRKRIEDRLGTNVSVKTRAAESEQARP